MTQRRRRLLMRLRRAIGAAIVLGGMTTASLGAYERLCLAWNAAASA